MLNLVFKGYFEDAVVAYKNLVKNCIEKVFPKPLIKVSGLPSFGQVTVTQKGESRIVHLLTYLPELRGKKMQIIEEPIVKRKVELALRADGQRVKDVYLAPERKQLNFQEKGNYIEVVVPEINGYQMVVFESVTF